MVRRVTLLIAVAFSLLLGPYEYSPVHASQISSTVAFDGVAMFSTEDAAQAHCPKDVVVWLNTRTGIWHEKGMRWYGRTKQGAYVCRKEAAAAGYRDTENGQ